MIPRVSVYAGITDETYDKTNETHALKKFAMPLVNGSHKRIKAKSKKVKQNNSTCIELYRSNLDAATTSHTEDRVGGV